MASKGGIGQPYAAQVGVLWTGLAKTLSGVERFAADPELLDDDEACPLLRRLQYRLHVASEAAFALAPPSGIAAVHTELAVALAGARDATANVADALEDDGFDAALRCVHEWRGALFRVRLARLRLTAAPRPAPEPEVPRSSRRSALVALLLVAAGSAAFVGGAVTHAWPLWAIGIAAVCCSFTVYKPQ